MIALPLALSLSSSFTKVGAIAAFAALVGIAALSLLLFAQARELKRLREWAGRAPERAADLEQRVSSVAAARVQQPAAGVQPARPIPRDSPIIARPVGAAAPASAVPGTAAQPVTASGVPAAAALTGAIVQPGAAPGTMTPVPAAAQPGGAAQPGAAIPVATVSAAGQPTAIAQSTAGAQPAEAAQPRLSHRNHSRRRPALLRLRP
jgi:hypothetical protein